MVGFTGSRNFSSNYAQFIAPVVHHYQAAGQPIAAGCANGADKIVRQAAPSAQVFMASNYLGPAPARLAKRSAAMVRAVSQSQNPLIVGFTISPCPAAVRPRGSFFGGGSGTWGTLALAAGLGLPIIVFWPAITWQPTLPAWGNWQPVVVAGQIGFSLHPAGTQAPLF